MNQNRQQRRHGPQGPITETITHQFGHNGTQVVVIFSQPVRDLILTPEQAAAFQNGMQVAIDGLKEYTDNPEAAVARHAALQAAKPSGKPS